MSAYDPTKCISIAGRLVLNPTTLQGAYPFSGTPLGIVSRAQMIREQEYAYENSEARGRNKVQVYGGKYSAALAFVLVQYDPDALNKVWAFNTTSPNGYQGANILTIPKAGLTSLSPGKIVATSPLLLAADDPALPSTLILYPLWTLGPKLALDERINAPYETGIVVVAGIDANGNDVRSDLIENLSLV